MSSQNRLGNAIRNASTAACSLWLLTASLCGQQVTFQPYIQPGDAPGFGPNDQMVIALQTDESSPNTSAYVIEWATDPDFKHSWTAHPCGRAVDNYLSADPTLAGIFVPTAYGPHTDYYALLPDLNYDTQYFYRVS